MNFEISQNFNFQFPILKFIDFKITTNSFIYSLVEQSLETHFHKNNYRGKGYTFGKNLPNFSDLYTPNLGCGDYTSNRQRNSNCEKKVNVTNFEFPKSLYKSKYGESTMKSRSLEEKDDEKKMYTFTKNTE